MFMKDSGLLFSLIISGFGIRVNWDTLSQDTVMTKKSGNMPLPSPRQGTFSSVVSFTKPHSNATEQEFSPPPHSYSPPAGTAAWDVMGSGQHYTAGWKPF